MPERPPRVRDNRGPLGALAADERAVSPAVAKTLEAGIVLLYIALVAGVVLGGAVSGYRAAADHAVGDRTLVAAAHEVEAAVPTVGRSVHVERAIPLPATIRGESYVIVGDGRALVLEHPDARVGGRVGLAVPAGIDGVHGRVDSATASRVVVTGRVPNVTVRLADGTMP